MIELVPTATGDDRAGLDAAEAEFLTAFPEFDPAGTFAELRRTRVRPARRRAARLPRLHRRRAPRRRARSTPTPSCCAPRCSATRTRTTRRRWPRPSSSSRPGGRCCEFFNAPPDEYLCIFTANASAALRLVGESYPFAPGGTFALTFDNHNSVNGIREFARRKGAAVAYVPVVAPELRIDRAAMHQRCSAADPSAPQPARLPGAVELLRRPAPPRPRRRGPRRRVGRAPRRRRLRPDQPARRRPRPARLRDALVLQDDRLPDRRRLPADAPRPGRDARAPVVRRRHRSRSPRCRATATTSTPTRRRSRTAPSTTSTSPPSRPGCATSSASGSTPSTTASPPDVVAARRPHRPPPRQRPSGRRDPRADRHDAARRHRDVLDARPRRSPDRRPSGRGAGQRGQHLAADRVLLQPRRR